MADDWFNWSFLDNTPLTGLGSDAATFNPDAAVAPPTSAPSFADFFPQINAGPWAAGGDTGPVDLSRFVASLGSGLDAVRTLSPGAVPENFGDPGGAAAPFLAYDRQTGNVVDVRTGAVIVDAERMRQTTEALKNGDTARLAAILEPVNKALNTPLGGTLAALGLGAAGIGLSRAIAGDSGTFRPPARIGSVATNPAAMALSNEIRMRNLAALRDISPGGTGDPITVDLTTRLRKALAGEVSSPVLERANRLEREGLEAGMLRRTRGSPLWRESSAGIEATGRLNESQAIRQYLDNMQTIGQLEPRIAARQRDETNRLVDLSGVNTMDAAQRYEDALTQKLAYNQYLEDRGDKADLAKAVATIFGRAAGGLTGGARRPWDRVNLAWGLM